MPANIPLMTKIKGARWFVIVLIFLAAVLNYVDRQTLSVLAPTMQHDLGMDDRQYADIINLFLLAYTVAYLVSGKLVDKLGTRLSLSLFLAWWSVANILTSTVQGMRSLGACRFLLGLGEAGVWPAASKAVSEWFPARERALAIGIYSMGATMGATMTPYLVIHLTIFSKAGEFPFLRQVFGIGAGWRLAFILTGLMGLLLIIPWLIFYRLPRQSKYVSQEELHLIEDVPSGEDTAGQSNAEKSWSWKQALAFKATWLLLLGRLITDPIWYFYQFWFPKYLNSERGFSQEQLKITWLIYAAAGLGSILGGWLSGQLIRRGASPVASRFRIMLGCACLLPLSPMIAQTADADVAMMLAFITVLASLAWLVNISALVVDTVPKHSVGTVFGIVAAGSTLGGIIMNTIVAAMVCGTPLQAGGFMDQTVTAVFGGFLKLLHGLGYGHWFLIMAFLHPIAWLVLWLGGIGRYSGRSARHNLGQT